MRHDGTTSASGMRLAAGLAALAVALAACGSGTAAGAGSSTTTSTAVSSLSPSVPSGSAAVSAATAPGSATAGAIATGGPASPGGVVVTTAIGALGSYLTDAKGMALYLWVKDDGGASRCSAACAAVWPPLTTSGAPHATGGADQSKLGTVARPDGSMQVTYNGWPLYHFVKDKTPGQTSGQGSDGFGAKWWLVAPSGAAITGASLSGPGGSSGRHSAGSTSGASATSAAGGGYGYGS